MAYPSVLTLLVLHFLPSKSSALDVPVNVESNLFSSPLVNPEIVPTAFFLSALKRVL